MGAGVLSDQAAVELLASCCNGRHIRPGVAWVKPCVRPGWYWLDADALADFAATRTATSSASWPWPPGSHRRPANPRRPSTPEEGRA